MNYLGIDGCKEGWVLVYIQNGFLEYSIGSSLVELLHPFEPESSSLLIDMPVVLLNATSQFQKRPCDVAARKLLGKKSAAVFSPPVEETLDGVNYQEACQLNQEVTGKKISLQAWYLFPKIRDLRSFLKQCPQWNPVIKESHPELVFQRFNQLKPLRFSKKTKEGIQERLSILQSIKSSSNFFYEKVYKTTKRNKIAADDLLDAMALSIRSELGDFTSFFGENESLDRPRMDYFF